jgi:Ala-tRNA(Pro) deacylase
MPDRSAPATEQVLLARLASLEIPVTTHRHAAVHTVEENRALRGNLPGGHCKSLFFKDKKSALWLVVTLEDRVLDLKALPKFIGSARLSFGKPELLLEALGVAPGAVTPFAVLNDPQARIAVVLDRLMLDHDPLNYHPLHNEATTAISPAGLLAFLHACGHEPAILDLGA